MIFYSAPSSHLIGHDSWSPDELNDTHLDEVACTKKLHVHAIFCKITCACNWACNFMGHAILARWVSFNSSGLHECCPMSWPLTSTYYIPFYELKIRLTFPLYFLKFPLYIQKGGALRGKCIYNPNHFFVGFIWSIHSYIFIAIYKK